MSFSSEPTLLTVPSSPSPPHMARLCKSYSVRSYNTAGGSKQEHELSFSDDPAFGLPPLPRIELASTIDGLPEEDLEGFKVCCGWLLKS